MHAVRSRILLLGILSAALLLLACRTTDFVLGSLPNSQNGAAVQNQSGGNDSSGSNLSTNPANSNFQTSAPAVCSGGDDTASIVTGTVLQHGNPVVGQRVQASSGPGGAPITDEPALTDDNGMFNVVFACDGKACDGAFFVWLVDQDLKKDSPFVEFIFDQNCRRGTIDFEKP